MLNKNEEILKIEQASTDEFTRELLKLPEEERKKIFFIMKGMQLADEGRKVELERPAV